MKFNDLHKDALQVINNDDIVPEKDLLKILNNCCQILVEGKEDTTYLSKNPLIKLKQLYITLIYLFAESRRHSKSSVELSHFLINECNIKKEKAIIIENYYKTSTNNLKYQLLNIGNYAAHITDIRWKTDYTLKSCVLEQSEGPVFRISIKTEKCLPSLHEPIVNFINFTCNSQEMQDLVYKLKDAVRHCHKVTNRSRD